MGKPNARIDGKTVIFASKSEECCVQFDGNTVRIFKPDAVLDPLVTLSFSPQAPTLDGGKLSVGKFVVSFSDNSVLKISGKRGEVYSDYEGDATVYETEKDFSLAELEGHKTSGTLRNYKTQINVRLGRNDRIYGLGDKAAQIDRRGYRYEQWNSDDPSQHNETYKSLYKSINFVLVGGDNGYYGLFYPDPHRSLFDLGAYRDDLMYIASESGGYDYFIILGDSPSDVVSEYTRLVGRSFMPRLKMLGYQQSRWSYATEKEMEEVASAFKANGIPLDYIHLDIDYMDGYRVYTVDKNKFPDLKAMSDRLKAQGIELVTILDPGVKYDTEYSVYNGLAAVGGLATRHGEIYHNAVWPGDSVYPDYFNASAAATVTKLTSEFMEENGVSAIWCDMNEPASFNGPLPDDVMFGEYPHSRVHNLYGDYMVRAVCKAFEQRGERPYVITRACFATSAPFTTCWNGDNQSLWAHLRASLPQIATMGICGFPLDGVDIGGFGNECTKELLIRWTEANIFSPLLRNHSSINTRSQEPYAFDEQTLTIIKKFLRMRYDFTPYLYDLAYCAHETGAPIIRPLFYNYPDDRECDRISDEVMIGESLLLAPILDPGATCRSVYFPRGTWIPVSLCNADKMTHKNGYAAVTMPIDSTGLYIEKHSIVPMYSGLDNLSKKPDELTVLIGGGKAKYVNCEDDGKSVECKPNRYLMTYKKGVFSLNAQSDGYRSDYRTLRLIKGKKSVTVPFDTELKAEI